MKTSDGQTSYSQGEVMENYHLENTPIIDFFFDNHFSIFSFFNIFCYLIFPIQELCL